MTAGSYKGQQDGWRWHLLRGAICGEWGSLNITQEPEFQVRCLGAVQGGRQVGVGWAGLKRRQRTVTQLPHAGVGAASPGRGLNT